MNGDTVQGAAPAGATRPIDSKCAAAESAKWMRRAVGLLVALFAFRLIYTALVPLDLVHDEAYYWDWSRRLDWGYYSKPPMVAWLIAAATRTVGSTALGVRLPSVLLGIGGLVWICALGSRMYGRRTGFWTLVLAAAMPASASLGLLMTIDSPLLFCWTAALYALWRVWEADGDDWRWLPVLILATGIGVLSKQTMLGFFPLAGIFLLTSRDDRRRLLRPAFWIWSLASLAFLAPIIWWNSRHDWITLKHTQGHFGGEPLGIADRISHFGEFLGSQLAVISPVTCCLLAVVFFVAWQSFLRRFAATVFSFRRLRSSAFRSRASADRRMRFLFCFSGLPLTGVLCLGLWQEVEANWPLAFYPAGLILLAGWSLGRVELATACRDGRRTLRLAALVGAGCLVVTYLLPFGLGLQGSRLDPVVRLRGWQRLGECVGAEFAQLPDPQRSFVYVTTGRAATSELAFYMPTRPSVYLWNASGRILSQYDLWPGPDDKRGWDSLIVTNPSAEPPPGLAARFRSLRPLDEVRVEIGNGRVHAYQLWLGSGFDG